MDIKFLENSIGRMVVYLKSSVYKNVLYICYILLDQYWIWRVRPWARLLNRFNVMYMSLRTLLYLDMFPKPGENLYSSYKKKTKHCFKTIQVHSTTENWKNVITMI